MAQDTGNGDPTYQRLSAEIRAWLDQGMFGPGEQLPSITELAADRGLSRTTCSRAMQTLAKEGLLMFYPGIGYHVRAPAGEGQNRPHDGTLEQSEQT